MRIVINTSVLVSGLIRPQGIPGDVLRSLRDGKFEAGYPMQISTSGVRVGGRFKITRSLMTV